MAFAELTPLDADDSLDINETVSLNAESLSGLSVRGSRIGRGPVDTEPASEPLPLPLSDEVDMDDMVEFVTPDMVELERLCVRPWRPMLLTAVADPFVVAVSLLRCSSILNSPKMASSSASCVSSKLAIENRYELVRSEDVWLCGRNRGSGVVFGISRP